MGREYRIEPRADGKAEEPIAPRGSVTYLCIDALGSLTLRARCVPPGEWMRMSLSSTLLSVTPSTALLAPSRAERGDAVFVPALLLAAVYAIPIFAALRPVADPVMDPDIWWHLRVGQWIDEHRAVPATDVFSRYGEGKPWVAYSWLYELLVYHLYEMFGLAGIVAYRLAMSLAVVAMLHRLIRRREPRFLVAICLTGIATLALTPLFSERPWLFTILFTTLTLDKILEVRAGRSPRTLWVLPLVYALWANLHIQFVYGFLLLGLACLSPWFDVRFFSANRLHPLPSSGEIPQRKQTVRRLFVLAGLCLAATLANPYHVRLYGVVVEYATQSGPFRCINELRAMEFRETPDWVVLLLGAAGVFALGRHRRSSSFEFLFLLAAGILAFRARRDLWFLVLASVTVLASRRALAPRMIPFETRTPPRLPSWIVTAMMLTALIAFVAWQRDLSEDHLRRKVAGVFPVEAVAVITARDYEGPIFNDFNWGGFLIWSLPRLPVVLDGRTNLHGDERIFRIGNTWAAGPGWRDDPDLNSAGVVLADVHSPLGCVLALDERFQLAHEDAVARVFVRKRKKTSPD